MYTYLIDLSLTWIVLIGIYKLFLEKEKFFLLNRSYLLGGLTLGLLLPMISHMDIADSSSVVEALPRVNEVYQTQLTTVDSWTIPIEQINQPETTKLESKTTNNWPWSSIILWIYILGIIVSLVKAIKSSGKLFSILRNGEFVQYKTHIEVLTKEKLLPFSFFKYVFIGEAEYSIVERSNILEHELHHINSFHSIDVIFIEALKIIFWWNPIIYLYRRAITENHEYSADAAVLKSSSRKIYCSLLLQNTFPNVNLNLTNPFFQSYIKKRITMMYRTQSKKANLIKYGISFIALVFLCILFIKPISAQNLEEIISDQVISIEENEKGEYPKEITVSQKGDVFNEGIDYTYNQDKGEVYITEGASLSNSPINVSYKEKYGEDDIKGILDKELISKLSNRSETQYKLQPSPVKELVDSKSITKYSELLRIAKSEEKYILLNFYADWCSPCKAMKEKTFSDRTIKDILAKHFLVSDLDIEEATGHSFKEKYNVNYLPTIIIMDADGSIYERIEGTKTSEEMKLILNKYNTNSESATKQEGSFSEYWSECQADPEGIYYLINDPVRLSTCPVGDDPKDHCNKELNKFSEKNFILSDEAIEQGFIGTIFAYLVIDEKGELIEYFKSNNMPLKHNMTNNMEDLIAKIKDEFKFEPGKCDNVNVKCKIPLCFVSEVPDNKKHLIIERNSKTVTPKQALSVNRIGIYEGKGQMSFHYRSNMNVPTTVSVEDPTGKVIFNEEYKTMYMKIYKGVEVENRINGEYIIKATQDGQTVSNVVECTIF